MSSKHNLSERRETNSEVLVKKFLDYRRSMSIGRESISYTPEVVKAIQKTDAVVRQFLEQKDVPHWFRGLSEFQLNAGMELFNAIRDDTEQKTSHRVLECLSQLGLEPMINARNTTKLMYLSHGNDLAFLWFLMEWFYKTNGPDYSVNEQIIMSVIAKLDTLTTLRELDRILPPGHLSPKEIERQRRLKLQQESMNYKPKHRKSQHSHPYFEKLRRPRSYGKPLTMTMPDFKVKLDQYNQYKNPNHVIHNEANRWYADHELQPSKRIANRIINDEILNIFDDFSAATLKTETVKTLCEHHKVIQELEKSFEHKLRVIARDRCMKLIEFEKSKKKEHSKLIKEQLERDVNAYVCKFHRIAKESRKHCAVQILSSECGCDVQYIKDYDDDMCAPPRPPCLADYDHINVDRHLRRESGGNIFVLSEKNAKLRKCSSCSGQSGMGDGADSAEDLKQCHDRCAEGLPRQTQPPFKKRVGAATASNRVPRATSLMDFRSKLLTGFDYGHSEASTPTASQTYFRSAAANQPYHFDYRKIFNFKENSAENMNIKRAFIEAVDSDVELLRKLQDREPVMDEAVQRCVNKIWRKQVHSKNIELDAQEERIRRLPEELKESPLNYEAKIYDPDDTTLMLQMLKDAMEYMRQNPKFVLASMPDAHKIPMLRNWIQQRYGKQYTRSDRWNAFQISLDIFHALNKITLDSRPPTTRELGRNLLVDYSCRNYLVKKSNYIRKEYYKRLDNVIMDSARIFWFAMSPHLCSNGPPRNTYFAYMPSRMKDILNFRLWKRNEFMRAKAEWERRQCIKNNKIRESLGKQYTLF